MKGLNQRWFRERFGALLGSFWPLLGVFWELFGGPFWYKKNVEFRFGIHLGSFARFLLLTLASKAPKRSLTELDNLLKTFFGSKMLIFQKCKDFCCKTIIFQAWRGSSRAQNRLQEVPKRNSPGHRAC